MLLGYSVVGFGLFFLWVFDLISAFLVVFVDLICLGLLMVFVVVFGG